jgi:carboxyl-terminal processing protease
MRKKSFRTILVLMIISCMLLSQTVFAESAAISTTAPATTTDNSLEYLQSVMNMIKEKYKGEITDEKLIEGALKGMFGSMDAYTQYFTVDETKEFLGALNGTYEGIGVMIEKQGDYVTVIKVFATSPAENSGILPGDKIAKVEGKSVIGASIEEVKSKIIGAAGTKVNIEFLRGTNQKITKVITRGKITISPVTYEIKGDIGYIKLDSFSDDSNAYITKALDAMDKKNIKKVILDLRDNGGGYVDQVVLIAQKFVPAGLITKLDYKSEEYKDIEYLSYLIETKYKLAVLVNGMSASASEILAGAIQDTGAGTLIGTKTFGKAKVQNFVNLLKAEAYDKYSKQLGVQIIDASDLMKYGIIPLDSEIQGTTKITVGMYTTPKGRMIDLKGLTPDITVADPVIQKNIDVKSIQKLSEAAALKLSNEGVDVYNAEKILTLSGYTLGTPDMKFDDKTSVALKKFQKDNKGSVTGQLDLKTQQLLNAKLDKLILSTDKQYAKAIEILNK